MPSARDGVQYRKASMLEMILGNANNGCGICFYLLMMYASYIANARIRNRTGSCQVSLLQEQDFLMDSQMLLLQHCSKNESKTWKDPYLPCDWMGDGSARCTYDVRLGIR